MELKNLKELRRVLDKLAKARPWPNKQEVAYLESIFAHGTSTPDPLSLLGWCWGPEIEFAEVGSNAYWEHGKVTETGWYVHPYCHPGCCRPDGPFATREDALLQHRRELIPSAFRKGIKLDIEKLIHPLDADDPADDASH